MEDVQRAEVFLLGGQSTNKVANFLLASPLNERDESAEGFLVQFAPQIYPSDRKRLGVVIGVLNST